MQVSTPEQNFTQKYYVSPLLAKLAYPLAKYLILPIYFGKIKITGKKNVPRSGPVIIAPTHRSRWDAIMLPYATGRLVSGRDLRFMVSANEMKGFQGWFVKRFGGFPVDTDRPSISSFRNSVEILCNSEMLTIFPEGNIFRDTQIHPLKEGLARIALQVQVDRPELGIKIVPVSIHYSKIFPSWRTKIYINIGSPIKVADYEISKIKQSSKKITADLEAALKLLYKTTLSESSELDDALDTNKIGGTNYSQETSNDIPSETIP
jgi:1-acyl-sn-glycerol-3-phosphate acyltransferase